VTANVKVDTIIWLFGEKS